MLLNVYVDVVILVCLALLAFCDLLFLRVSLVYLVLLCGFVVGYV